MSAGWGQFKWGKSWWGGNAFLDLITDRQQSDFDLWLTLSQIEWADMTSQQKAIWTAPMKGAYNYTDFNRVGAAMLTLQALIASVGYAAQVNVRTDYAMGEWPTHAETVSYIQSLKNLKAVVPITTVPPPDTMDDGTVVAWNNIEQILLDVEDAIIRITSAWFYADEIYAGEI